MFNLGENRDTFIELLKPAGDFRIEYIFGTSLVLDIRWLFNLLLSLSENSSNKERWSDPGRLLSAIRSYRGKLDLFIQSGKIEKSSYDILLEEGRHFIRQVRMNNNHIFHPKVWVIEYSNPENELLYKVIISSRNAVFGATLESYILLEGKYDEKIKPGNSNLITFIKDCFKHSSDTDHSNYPNEFIERLSKVIFLSDKDFSDDFFHYQGFETDKQLMDLVAGHYDHIMVFSPFLTVTKINELCSRCDNFTLVSTYNNLSETLKEFHFKPPYSRKAKYFYVNHFIPYDSEDEAISDMNGSMDIKPDNYLGFDEHAIFHPGFMHSKMYFLYKKGNPLEMILGSANCTDGGLGGKSVEAVAKVLHHGKTINNIFDSFIYKKDKNDNISLHPYMMEFNYDRDVLQELTEEEKLKRKAQDIFQEIMNLKWSASHFNSELVVECLSDFETDEKHTQLEIENCKLSSDGFKPLLNKISSALRFTMLIEDDMVPGSIFLFKFRYEGLKDELVSLVFLPIAGSPFHWSEQYENQLLSKLDSISAWYLFIFGLLYRENIYEKSKSQRNVCSAHNMALSIHSSENQTFSLERLLGLGEIEEDVIKEIDKALEIFDKKLDDIKDKERYTGLLEELIAFKELFKIYSEAMP